MRILRVLLAGLVALGVLLAGAVAAAVILLTGMVGFVIQLIRRQGDTAPSRSTPAATRRSAMRSGDVIDVVATHVPPEPTKR